MLLGTFHPNVPHVGHTGEATDLHSRSFHGIYSLDMVSQCPWGGLVSILITRNANGDNEQDDFGQFSPECSARGAHWGG